MRRAVTVVALLAATTMAACGGGPGDDGPREVVLTMRHSRFEPAVVEATPGERIRFVVRNLDPIDHELIVGDRAVQERHEKGTEPHHAPRDGEVSVAAGTETATTWLVPTRGGPFLYGCHLPGHWDYGMRGTIRLT